MSCERLLAGYIAAPICEAKRDNQRDWSAISDRAEIEHFDGPHTINGIGTFEFLKKWLR